MANNISLARFWGNLEASKTNKSACVHDLPGKELLKAVKHTLEVSYLCTTYVWYVLCSCEMKPIMLIKIKKANIHWVRGTDILVIKENFETQQCSIGCYTSTLKFIIYVQSVNC